MQTKHNPLPVQMACIDGVPWRQAFGAKPSSISCDLAFKIVGAARKSARFE